jgi:transcriptional regulator with XRE-family HTH domain
MFRVVSAILTVMRDIAEVGRIVARRRLELGMDAAQLARTAAVDPKTVASLEHGERWPRDRSRVSIESALGWKAGSLDDIRAGGEPTQVVSGDPLDSYSTDYLLDVIRRRMTPSDNLPLAARTSDEPKPK